MLAISQPSVSKAIAEVEHAVGLRLLDRGAQGIEPTIYGRALLKCGVAVFDELRQGVRELDSWPIRQRVSCVSVAPKPWRQDSSRRHRSPVARSIRGPSFIWFRRISTRLLNRELRQRTIELVVASTPGLHPEGTRTWKFCSTIGSWSWPVQKINGSVGAKSGSPICSTSPGSCRRPRACRGTSRRHFVRAA